VVDARKQGPNSIFVPLDVVIVVSENQMNVFAENAASELADLIKSTK
jgi:hypothetical protein